MGRMRFFQDPTLLFVIVASTGVAAVTALCAVLANTGGTTTGTEALIMLGAGAGALIANGLAVFAANKIFNRMWE